MPRSSNATASAFGWEFQSNAAIMLMLKNIESASKVKVEGETEDVEITFTNGRMLMAQAKSVINPDDVSFVIDKLEAALKTLNKASQIANIEKLVYVTNSPNPFSDVTTMYKFSSPLNMVPFSELCDTFPHKHHSTGSKALWTKRPYGGKSGGPSETNEGNNLYFEEWNDGVTP